MESSDQISVNPGVLKWAREALVLSRTAATERTNISLDRLDQLESGNKNPTLEELKIMSKAYKRTIATFLLTEPPVEKPLPRDRRTTDSVNIDSFHEKTVLAVRKARALAKSLLELRGEMKISNPIFNTKAGISDTPQIIARRMHEEMQLAEIRQISDKNLVLDSCIEKVEKLGIAVFQLSLTQDGLRGLSIVDEEIPIIGIKRGNEKPSGKIFTLFHELGHIILNEGGMCDISLNINVQGIEKWCNAFSAEILMPSNELMQLPLIKEYIGSGEKIWPNNDLEQLANYFQVSKLAILRCLLEHNLTTPEFYKKKHSLWNKPSFGFSKIHEGRNIPGETIKEKGKTYISLAFKAFDQSRIDIKDLADYLGVKISYIPKTRQLLTLS